MNTIRHEVAADATALTAGHHGVDDVATDRSSRRPAIQLSWHLRAGGLTAQWRLDR